MKIKKLRLIMMILLFTLSTVNVNANIIESDNIHTSELVAQQAWYTKLIKLDKFGKKNIRGTLNFQLVPDNNAKKTYYRHNDPNNNDDMDKIELVPGVINHGYSVPFSSNDYVDSKFTKLARQAGTTNGETEELLNHAMLHEWGRMDSSDNVFQFSVGKLYKQQFENYITDKNEANEAYNNQKETLKQLAEENGLKVQWKGDPDTENVIGWKNNFGSAGVNKENRLYDFLGSYESGSQLLVEYQDFCKGNFNIIKTFKLHNTPAVTFKFNMTTRPIAISKNYDAKGNISSIEKPLIPCLDSWKFIENHNKVAEGKYGDLQDINKKIFRYRLKEKPATGINLNLPEKDIIVDVMGSEYFPGNIYMFEDEKSADEFYQKIFDNDEYEIDAYLIQGRDIGAKVYEKDMIQLVNDKEESEKLVSIPVRKVWKDANNKYKNRTSSVKISLFANGANTGKEITLNKDNNWKGKFINIPTKKDGKVIKYTVGEKKIPHYKIKIKGNTKEGFVVTNTYKVEKIKDKGKVTKNKKNPDTGDSTPIPLFVGLICISILGIYILTKKNKIYK